MALDMKKFLQRQQETWGETAAKAAESGGGANLPDGVYIAQMTGAELTETRKTGLAQIKSAFTILEGESQGSIKYDYLQLEGKRGIEPLAWRLDRLGVDPKTINLEHLPELLEDIVRRKLVMKISLRTVGDYQNLDIQTLLPNYNPEDASPLESTYTSPSAVGDAPAPPTVPGAEDDTDEVELQQGMKVSFTLEGKPAVGVVKEVREAKGEAVVQVGLKKHTVKFEDIEVLPEGTDS